MFSHRASREIPDQAQHGVCGFIPCTSSLCVRFHVKLGKSAFSGAALGMHAWLKEYTSSVSEMEASVIPFQKTPGMQVKCVLYSARLQGLS